MERGAIIPRVFLLLQLVYFLIEPSPDRFIQNHHVKWCVVCETDEFRLRCGWDAAH